MKVIGSKAQPWWVQGNAMLSQSATRVFHKNAQSPSEAPKAHALEPIDYNPPAF